ncbi:MAG: hypothetical protein IT359_03460 [Gemmatimonadaceae bacterium]|nr:hypothetical protein [Gemmatimonadaceae bacterium]
MPSFLRRIFPESLFPRRLDEGAERRMRLAQARAEDAIIETHVRNALMFIDTLSEDMPFDRAIDTYVRVMGVPEPLASLVATRVLVELGEELVPRRALRAKPTRDVALPVGSDVDPDATVIDRPALRLSDSAAAARR